MNIFRRILSRFSASPYVVDPDPRDDLPTIDMLTAKYNEAVDIMNQQTAALLAARGVLETYSRVPADKFTDAHAAIAEGCLEICHKAVARAESFPTPEILECLANPEPIPVERRCHSYEMGKADWTDWVVDSEIPHRRVSLADATREVIDDFKYKSDPRQPPNVRLMIALLGREAAASSPITYIKDQFPSIYDSTPPPDEIKVDMDSTDMLAHLVAIREYINKRANENDAEALRLRSAFRPLTVRETFPPPDEEFQYRDA